MRAKTRLARTLSDGKSALTVECVPPHRADTAATKALAGCFPPMVDAVVVGDYHDQARPSALAWAARLAAEGIEPVLSLVTRDRNRVALESDVLGAASLGVRSFLCLTGLHQSLGASPQAAGTYDLDAIQLSQALARMADEGVDFSGKRLESAPDLLVAAAVSPALRPLELNLLQLQKKVEAGAQVLFTDPVADIRALEQWMEAVRAAGLDRRVAIILSVHTTSVDLARQLRSVPGVRGLHLLSGGCEQTLTHVIQAIGLN
jgi:methylenetetrahydrofolate reductase (NADPH)